MPIGYVSHEAIVNDAGAVTQTTIPMPSGVSAGDLLLAAMSTTAPENTVVPPTGWTHVSQSPLRDGQATFVLCYRHADGTEPASYTWEHDAARSVGLIAAYSGVLLSVPLVVEVETETEDLTEHPIAPTDVPDGGWLVYIPIDRRNNAGLLQSWSTDDPLDVRRGEISGDSGSGSVFSIALFDSNRVVLDLQERTLTTTRVWSQMAVWSIGLAPNVQSVTPTGIGSEATFGTPSLGAGEVVLTPQGVGSTSVVGEPDVLTSGEVSPHGIASQAAVGTPLLNPAIMPTGIPSSTAMGAPVLARFEVAFTLHPPVIKQTPMAWNRLHSRFAMIRGISIIQRADGTYYTTQFPSQTELEDARKFYLGGYTHPLTTEEARELIDAGLGEYVERKTTPA